MHEENDACAVSSCETTRGENSINISAAADVAPDRREPRANRTPWRCATVVDVAVPLHDTMVVDEKELAMQRYLGLLAVGV